MTDLLVPFRFGDDPARDKAWSYVRRWYQQQHPGFTIRVGTCHPDEEWSKGRAVARAAAKARSDVFVIADADVLVSPNALEQCVEVVAAQFATTWAQPHDRVFRLSRSMTFATYAQGRMPSIVAVGNPALERRMHQAPPGGGIVVLSRHAYEVSGGIDPRFVGWGGDDISFARALDTLVGPCSRLTFPMWHLWHERAPRRPGNRASVTSEELAARYMIASGNVFAMRQVVDEHAA